ncbi:putative ankyrin repeat protein RF_0381 [Microplitis mediator]|uniref:putative ankyrin repeat protein RF_0381 n=1 Tax=Microplitis mediator TaxID=375433 RepID=UPI0025559B33|nr:putative ankyrin repeat protein RF_0381 [Microplitis mediator]
MDISKFTYTKVSWLIEEGFIKDVNGELPFEGKPTFLHVAVVNSDEKLVDYLLRKQADKNLNNFIWGTPLHVAVGSKNLKIIQTLINSGVNVNLQLLTDPWLTPLQMAVLQKDIEIAELLLENGADVNFVSDNPNVLTHRKTVLNIAIRQDDEQMVKLLLKHNADPNSDISGDVSPLHIATGSGNLKIIKILLAHGANINFVPVHGYINQTPLHFAVLHEHSKAVKLLLNYDTIDINIIADCESSVLHYGAMFVKFNYKIVQYLLDAGVDVNLKNDLGETALDIAAQLPGKVKLLIRRHIIKLIAANLHVSKENLAAVTNNRLTKARDSCVKEIEKMKKINIGESNLTFHDALFKDEHGLAT